MTNLRCLGVRGPVTGSPASGFGEKSLAAGNSAGRVLGEQQVQESRAGQFWGTVRIKYSHNGRIFNNLSWRRK